MVVWSLLRDDNIVNMALFETGTCYFDKLCLLPESRDIFASAVAHRRAKSAHHLMHYARDASTKRNTPLDTLRYKFVCCRSLLKVSVV